MKNLKDPRCAATDHRRRVLHLLMESSDEVGKRGCGAMVSNPSPRFRRTLGGGEHVLLATKKHDQFGLHSNSPVVVMTELYMTRCMESLEHHCKSGPMTRSACRCVGCRQPQGAPHLAGCPYARFTIH